MAARSSAHSAGIIVHRRVGDALEILLVHPGGPFWANKDINGWSIPKGEFEPNTESAIDAATREFKEELGHPVPAGKPIALPPFRAGRKTIHGFLVAGDLDPDTISSNHFEMEWPPKSGSMASFPEVDQAGWFTMDQAATKLHKGQLPVCDLITTHLPRGRASDKRPGR